jgi:hypothetical protein
MRFKLKHLLALMALVAVGLLFYRWHLEARELEYRKTRGVVEQNLRNAEKWRKQAALQAITSKHPPSVIAQRDFYTERAKQLRMELDKIDREQRCYPLGSEHEVEFAVSPFE